MSLNASTAIRLVIRGDADMVDAPESARSLRISRGGYSQSRA